METNDWKNETRADTAPDSQGLATSCGCEKIKTVIADKMHEVAATVGEKAARQDAQPAVAKYGKQAAEVLDESADYIEQFDIEQADARVREYVRQNPGLSLLIAGATGLIIGAIFRRR